MLLHEAVFYGAIPFLNRVRNGKLPGRVGLLKEPGSFGSLGRDTCTEDTAFTNRVGRFPASKKVSATQETRSRAVSPGVFMLLSNGVSFSAL